MKKIILVFLAFAYFGFAGNGNIGNTSTGKFSFKGKEEALRNMGLSEEEIAVLTDKAKCDPLAKEKARTKKESEEKMKQVLIRNKGFHDMRFSFK